MSTVVPRVEPALLDVPVSGCRLRPGTFRDQLDPGGTLVVFLRHLGCIFCRECVTDLAADRVRESLPPVLFVHPAGVAEGNAFFAKFDPAARGISDPECRFYEGFGIGRGGLGQLFGPSVIVCGFRATRKGNGIGPMQGDPWRMPGFFLVRDGEIVWEHTVRHAGDHPDFDRLPEELAAIAGSDRDIAATLG